jgi:hypothetical protein
MATKEMAAVLMDRIIRQLERSNVTGIVGPWLETFYFGNAEDLSDANWIRVLTDPTYSTP